MLQLQTEEQIRMVVSAFASVCDHSDDPGASDGEIELKPALLGLLGEIKSRV